MSGGFSHGSGHVNGAPRSYGPLKPVYTKFLVLPNILTYYWDDNRPSYGYFQHQITYITPTVGQNVPVDITYRGNEWMMTINDAAKQWYSMDNPPYSKIIETGSEAISSASILSGASSSGLTYYTMSGNLVTSWGTGTTLYCNSPATVGRVTKD